MRVVTWNLLWRFGDWKPRQSLIEEALLAQRPDVCLVQETWPRQAARLASVLGLELLGFGGGYFDQKLSSVPVDEVFGNAILARPNLGAVLVHDDPFDGPGDPAPRALLVARMGDVLIATSHLTHMNEAGAGRVAQLNHVAAVLDELDGPAVFCGDLNMVPWSPEHGVAESLGFLDEWKVAHPDPQTVDDFGATMTPDNREIASTGWMNDRNGTSAPRDSGVRLDYVMSRAASGDDGAAVRPAVSALERFGFGGEGRWPSDHLGLSFELEPPDR